MSALFDFIQWNFDNSDEELLAAIRSKADLLRAALVQKVNILNAGLQHYIQTEKLQGGVLNNPTNRLLNSVRMIPATVNGDVIEGTVQAGGVPGTRVVTKSTGKVSDYAVIQEFGSSSSYTIEPFEKKALAFGGQAEIFAGLLSPVQIVVKKVVHPPIQERSFMRSSLEENKDRITAGLQETVNEVASK